MPISRRRAAAGFAVLAAVLLAPRPAPAQLRANAGVVAGNAHIGPQFQCATSAPTIGAPWFAGLSLPTEGIAACGLSGAVDDRTGLAGALTAAAAASGPMASAGSFGGTARARAAYWDLDAAAAGTATGDLSPTTYHQAAAYARFVEELTYTSASIPNGTVGATNFSFLVDGALRDLAVAPYGEQGDVALSVFANDVLWTAFAGTTRDDDIPYVRGGSTGLPGGFVLSPGGFAGSADVTTTGDFAFVWGSPLRVEVALYTSVAPCCFGASIASDFSARLTGVTAFAGGDRVDDFVVATSSGTPLGPGGVVPPSTPVPEPSPAAPVGLGLAALGGVAAARRRATARGKARPAPIGPRAGETRTESGNACYARSARRATGAARTSPARRGAPGRPLSSRGSARRHWSAAPAGARRSLMSRPRAQARRPARRDSSRPPYRRHAGAWLPGRRQARGTRPAAAARPLALAFAALAALASACADAPVAPPSAGLVPDAPRFSVTSTTATYLPCGSTVPIKATITNATTGAAVAGLLLNFNVVAGGGGMYGGAAVTNAAGQAADSWTLGGTANVANTFVIHTVAPDGAKTEHYRKTVTTISRIAFVSERDAGDPEIYTQLPDGTGAKRLTTSPGIDAEPAWSFDGAKLAFVSYRSGIAQIYFVNADGSGLTPMSQSGTTGHADQHPSWSPDGRHLTFSRDSASIVVRSLAGGDIPSLGGLVGEESATFATGKHQDPVFSPDGAKIAFVLNSRLWVADWTLVPTSAHDIGGLVSLARYPAWSPDGTRLAFVSTRYDGNYELYVVNVDGTGIRRLTTFAGADLEPSWSPDGQQIVFASLRGTKYDLYSVNAADGSGLVQRTTNAANDYMPSWSRCAQ